MINKKELLKNFEEQKELTEIRVSEGIEKYRKGVAPIIVTKEINLSKKSDNKFEIII